MLVLRGDTIHIPRENNQVSFGVALEECLVPDAGNCRTPDGLIVTTDFSQLGRLPSVARCIPDKAKALHEISHCN